MTDEQRYDITYNLLSAFTELQDISKNDTGDHINIDNAINGIGASIGFIYNLQTKSMIDRFADILFSEMTDDEKISGFDEIAGFE